MEKVPTEVKYGRKTIQVVRGPRGYHYALQFKEGGQLPDALVGLYTSEETALNAVAAHPEDKKVREVA